VLKVLDPISLDEHSDPMHLPDSFFSFGSLLQILLIDTSLVTSNFIGYKISDIFKGR